ncbi:hypothetical protein F4778DRAFT_123644 [Xylariomycetidae sp. FL2044]|nr:hypothetical protein F4778DRAFT_123644 [Xylariomycetidae sp. FL2044]
MAGEIGPIVDHISLAVAMVIGGLFALAIWNSIEVYLIMLNTFHRRKSLYFVSIMLANTGIPLHAIPALLRFFRLAPSLPMAVLVCLGWWLMVTGQSVVLYSRLNLVVGDPRKRRWILCMIIAVFFFLQLPTSVLFIASNAATARLQDQLKRAFDGFEYTQLAVFSTQEMLISGLYVYEARTALEPMRAIKEAKVRHMFRQLIFLFIVVAGLDATIMATEYTGYFQIQTTFKPVCYSIKLKVELVVLNNLVSTVQSKACTCWDSLANEQSLPDTSYTLPFMGSLSFRRAPSIPGAAHPTAHSRGDIRRHSLGILDGSRDLTLKRTRSCNRDTANHPGQRQRLETLQSSSWS